MVGDFGDFEYERLSTSGISAEASNRVLEVEKELGNFPHWIGSIEVLDNGVRHVYRKDVDPEAGLIILSKEIYGEDEPYEVHTFDWQTGETVS